MSGVVADTSALVNLGTVADHDPSPLGCLCREYEVLVPREVVNELEEIASHADAQGQAAEAVLDRRSELDVRRSNLDADFPLDDGENTAVTLANDTNVAMFLCDEFNRLGLVHASLIDTRLVTTPKLLAVFVRNGVLTETDAAALLDGMTDARSWANNSYARRAREAF